MSEKLNAEGKSPDNKKMSLEDRLYLSKRKIDKWNHIEVDQAGFVKDPDPAILYVCPAKVYERKEGSQECVVNFENCLECGTCQVTCRDYVTWRNPNSGFGITLIYG